MSQTNDVLDESSRYYCTVEIEWDISMGRYFYWVIEWQTPLGKLDERTVPLRLGAYRAKTDHEAHEKAKELRAWRDSWCKAKAKWAGIIL